MTKQDICRAISEKLEPDPFSDQISRELQVNGGGMHGALSHLGFYRFSAESTLKKKGYNAGHWMPEGWVPVNYFTSEDASARLLEAMPHPSVSARQKSFRADRAGWACCYDKTQQAIDDIRPLVHADRKTAIVLAAIRWLGIEGEIE